MNAIRPGLCSVTLRAVPVDEVARVAGECGLAGIEWGGDVHVPPGDLVAAARAREATRAAGAEVASYGSYLFAAGVPTTTEMGLVLDTAVELGAPNVRVWAGFGVEAGTDAYAATRDGLARFCARAAERAVTAGLEFHGGTPTATVAGAQGLLEAVGAPNLFTYWQPPYWRAPTSGEADAAEIAALGSQLSHLHVYEWAGPEDRRLLAEGTDRWRAVLRAVRASTDGWPAARYAFLEFVAGDDPGALRRDAATLGRMLAEPVSTVRP
ncbi:MAG: TIM barrel protein [Acidimicrobiia bacterium]|nr:TIM barrel protein [Acidimicrobiia bacterium]